MFQVEYCFEPSGFRSSVVERTFDHAIQAAEDMVRTAICGRDDDCAAERDAKEFLNHVERARLFEGIAPFRFMNGAVVRILPYGK